MSNFFAPPSADAIAGTMSDGTYLRTIHYAALKTPESYAAQAKGQVLKDAWEKGQLGFSTYDKEQRLRVPIAKFAFVVLEVYSAVMGDNGESGDARVSYWSNRVKDSRVEPFRVFSSEGAKPKVIAEGIYQDIKIALPKGAGWKAIAVVYNLEDNQVYEMPLSAGLTRGLQHALADAAIAAGKKNTKWEKMQVLSLAANDHLWGFQFREFAHETKEGDEYAGKGELYFAPRFTCGLVQPVGNTKDLHALVVEAQNQLRAEHVARAARYGQRNNEQAAPVQNTPANQEQAWGNTQQPEQKMPWGSTTQPEAPAYGDDLPF